MKYPLFTSKEKIKVSTNKRNENFLRFFDQTNWVNTNNMVKKVPRLAINVCLSIRIQYIDYLGICQVSESERIHNNFVNRTIAYRIPKYH